MKVAAFGKSAFLLLALSTILQAHGRDLSGRFGFGVNNVGTNSDPALSLDWQLSPSSALEFLTSFDTETSTNAYTLGARFTRNLFLEENQHFFFFMGAGLRAQKESGKNENGYALETGAGSRLFLSGLPNFGLSFGGGIDFVSLAKTSLASKVFFGVHYYF